MYFAAQFPHGRSPSHFVLRDRHLSQLAHNAKELPDAEALALSGGDEFVSDLVSILHFKVRICSL